MENVAPILKAMSLMEAQSNLYRPTEFWKSAASMIAEDIMSGGLEHFRSLESTLGYFVPTYGRPGNGLTDIVEKSMKEQTKKILKDDNKSLLSFEMFLSGYSQALSDYRVFLAANSFRTELNFLKFSESSVGNPIEQFCFDGKNYSRSSLNYLLGLCFLMKHLEGELPKVFLEIGGGFGSLGEILSACGSSDIKYIDVDIPPTNCVAEYYLGNVLGVGSIATFQEAEEYESIEISKLPTVSIFTTWQIEKIVGNIDVFVNFISFQEMEPFVVRNYLTHVSRLNAKWVLLRNLREGKQKKTEENVGVETPILTADYMEMLPNYQLIEKSVLPFGYKTVDGYNSELLLFKRHSGV